jgi:hypothetical protein
MLKIVLFLIVIIGFLTTVLMYVFWSKKKCGSTNNGHTKTLQYKGLILFDIDGTLTVNGQDNEEIVQACIDSDFAVGICTAGSVYTMQNLLSYPWMPRNLYNFINKHNDITFNNVAGGVLMGKLNPNSYLKLPNHHPGYLKGFAMVETGKALGITKPECIILCDDQESYLQHALKYNSRLNVVCVNGADCGEKLTVAAVKAAMNKC